MAEGGALSFSQAKALILKQRLSADEVQKLESAPQAIFTERDKEVLFYFILLLQKLCNLNFPGFFSLYHFLVSGRGRPQPVVPLGEVWQQAGF